MITAALLLVAALPLAALDVPGEVQRSPDRPVFGSFELRLSGYRPNIDSEFTTSHATPFNTAFGGSRPLMFQGQIAVSLWHGFGTFELGAGAGFYQVTGHGITKDTGVVSADTTGLKIVPLSASLTYRLDWAADHTGFPIVPYVRASLLRYQWWVTDGSGNTATFTNTSNQTFTGSGATNGYSFTGGLAFLLDFLDPSMARDMEEDTGIHHTYLFADVTKTFVNDFGSKKSWDLSNDKIVIAGGLLVVF
jgi:hypothetical protein